MKDYSLSVPLKQNALVPQSISGSVVSAANKPNTEEPEPLIFVSTREAFANIRPHRPEYPVREVIRRPVAEWKDTLINDFEASVFPQYPVIGEIKEERTPPSRRRRMENTIDYQIIVEYYRL